MGEVVKPAEPPPDLKAAEAAEETPAAPPEADAPPAEEAAPAEEAPAAEEPDDTEDEGDGPVAPLTSKKAHLRFAETDKVGRLAAALMKRNRDMQMEEAVAKAKIQLGIPAEKTADAPAKPKSDLPDTVELVDSTLETLDGEREKALTDLRFEDVAKIDRKIRSLDRHRVSLERAAERQQSEAAHSYHSTFTQSEAKAADLYPDASKADSAFGARMKEIDADLEANGDPLFDDPTKPLRIAQMVAREMNIAPKKKGAPAAPAKAAAAAPAAPAAKKGVVPSGASRTTPPAVNAKPAIVTKIESAKSLLDIRNIRKELGLPN